MKKAIACLAFMIIISPVFANDARVVPAGVLRITVAPTYAFADKQQYLSQNEDLDVLHDGASRQKLTFLNLGLAVELGATDWLTLEVQWIPGWTLLSSLEFSPNIFAPSHVNIDGFDDLFAGIKVQLVGDKGLIRNAGARLALEPGVIVPLPDENWDDQAARQAAGQDFTILSLAKHAYGYGARLSFDYYLTSFFFFNLFGEYIHYSPMSNAQMAPSMPRSTINWGNRITFELEPRLEFRLFDAVRISAGMPIAFKTYDALTLNGAIQIGTLSQLLIIEPNVAVRLEKASIPLELKFSYSLPIDAADLPLINSLKLEIKSDMVL
jgi:hypothetical protein